jgi:hypothetical protein
MAEAGSAGVHDEGYSQQTCDVALFLNRYFPASGVDALASTAACAAAFLYFPPVRVTTAEPRKVSPAGGAEGDTVGASVGSSSSAVVDAGF